MEISSVASQAMALKEQMTQYQLGIAAVKQADEAQKLLADMLTRNAAAVPPAEDAQKGGFSTYA